MKNLKLPFITILIIVSQILVGQSKHVALGGSSDDYFNSIYSTSDGGYLACGNTASNTFGAKDIFLVKLDNNLDTVWTKTLGDNDVESLLSCTELLNGTYVFSGFTESFEPISSVRKRDFVIFNTDVNGNVLWKKILGVQNNSDEVGYHIYKTNDGGFAFCGGTKGSGGDIFVAKYTNLGVVQWERTYRTGSSQSARRMIQTSDGGYLVTGWDWTPRNGQDDAFLLKLDPLGNQTWRVVIGTGSLDLGVDILEIGSNYYLYGFTQGTGAGNRDVFIARYDLNGSLLNYKVIGGPNRDQPAKMTTDQTAIWLTGSTNSFDASNKIFVLKLDLSLDTIYSKKFTSTGTENAGEISLASNGCLIIGGNSNAHGLGGYDGLLIRTNVDGSSDCFDGYAPFRTQSTGMNPMNASFSNGTFLFTNYNGFSEGGGCDENIVCPLVLPVKLTDFSGASHQDYNELTWQTASEVNNDYFAVEKSDDALSFIEIARVEGNGNSSITQDYTYQDYDQKKLQYYRLKQVDYDGTITYSNTISITSNPKENSINFYPNPSHGDLFLDIPGRDETYTIVYSNVIGGVHKELLYTSEGMNNYQLQEFNQLNTGIYFIQILDSQNNVVQHQKVIKK